MINMMRTNKTRILVARAVIMLVAFLFLAGGAKAQTPLFSEDFENTEGNHSYLPTGWTTEGPVDWKVGIGDHDGSSTGAGEGSYNAKIFHTPSSNTGDVTKLITPEIDLSSVTTTTANLSFMHIQRKWDSDNSNHDELRIYYRNSPDAAWTMLVEFTDIVDSWTTEDDIPLPNLSATYQIAFERTDGWGRGVGIDNVVITEGTATLPRPMGLSCTLTPGNGTVATLSWMETGTATAWQICLNGDESNLIEVTTTSHTFTNLTSETTYTAKVRAKGSGGSTSSWSYPVSFTPSSIYQLTVNDDDESSFYVPIYGYYADDVQRSEFIIPATSLTALCGGVISSMTFYPYYDFTTEGSFQVYLKAVNESAFSEDASFYTAEGATTVYNGTLTLSQADGMTITIPNGYEYDGDNLLIGFYKGTAGGNSMSELYYGFYGVEATGASITSDGSNGTITQRNFLPKTTFVYTPGTGYYKPTNLTVGQLSNHAATLTWTPPTGTNTPTGYAWQYKVAGNGEWGTTETTTTETTVTLNQLAGNTTYDFRVKAVYDDGVSNYVTTSFTTTASVPTPTDLTCTLTPGDGTKATLNWTETGTATAWQICLNNDEANLITTTTTSYTFTDLTPGNTYTAKVRAVDNNENSLWSNTVSFMPTDAYEFTVNDGTDTSEFVPVNGYWADCAQGSEFIIPATKLTTLTGCTITSMKFYANYNFTSTGSFKVYLKEVDEAAFTNTTLYNANEASTVYTGTVTISADDGMTINMTQGFDYNGGNLLIGFSQEASGGNCSSSGDAFYGVMANGASLSFHREYGPDQRNFLPKVTFGYLPGSNPKPSALTIGTLTSNSATLTWTAPSGSNTPTSYVWQYKAASGEWETPETTTGTTATLSSLTANTTYDFRVKAVYADVESSYVTITFTTPCPIPFTCDFENTTGSELPTGWTTDGPGKWQVGTGDNNTSTGAGEGSKNALIKHSSNDNVTKLITPLIDLSSAATATLSFMHIQRAWSGDQDQLRVYYRTSPNAAWTLLEGMEFTGNISTWTTEEGVSLPNPSSTYQIAFEMTDGYGYGVGIDKVEIASASMPKPTGLTYTLTPGDGTVATLSWTETGSATAWQICLNDDEDNLIEATTNTYALTSLTPETTYTAKVRAVVSGEYSSWSDEVSFTPTNSYQLTVNDGTDTNTDVPIKSDRGNFRQRSEFIIPASSLTAIPTGRIITALKFYANHDFTSTGSFQVYLREVDETVFSSTNFYTADGATIVYSGTLTVSKTDGMTISMDDGYEYEGGNLLVGFYKQIADENASSGSNNAFYGVTASGASLSMWSSYTTQQRNFLPKVTISYLPDSYRKPQNLTVDELTSNSATLTWTAPADGTPTGYAWWCKEAGSEQWGDETTTTGTSVTLSQLKGNTTYDFRVKAVYSGGRSVYVTTSFLTDCGEYPLPYTCNFEDLDEKRCWTMVNCTENHSVWLNYTESNTYARSGNRYFMFSSLEPTDGPQYLISPALSGTEDGVHVSFYYRSLQDGISYESKFKVGYSTTGNSPQNFTWGDEISCLSADYLRFSATYPANTKYVAVQYLDTEMYYLLIDDFTFEAAAACPEPTGVTATATTTNGATISWTNGSDETAWDIYATTDCNDVPGNTTTPTVANTETKPNTIENLASGTTYYIYVRAIKDSDKSNWSTPAMVDTKAEPVDLPYSYGFEDKRLPCAWGVITTIPAYLTAIIDNEVKANAHTGDNYLRFRRRQKANTQESEGTLIAVLPEVASTYSLNGYQITFWAKKTEDDTNPALTVGIMTDPDDATTFVQQGTTIVPTDTYQQYTVRFNEYTGTGHYIAIREMNYGEACIDDIVVEELPACWPIEDLAVANITAHTADLSWTGYSDAYNVSYRTAEINGGFSESFSKTSAPDGWERKEGLLSSVMNGTTVLGTAASSSAINWKFGTADDVFDSHARINIYGTSAKNWLITPTFTPVNGVKLEFDLALTAYNGGAPGTTGTDDRFVVLITTDNMGTWSILREWNNSGSQYVYNNIASTTGDHITIGLSAYAGKDVRIAFYGESTTSNADNDLHIDNVAVDMNEPAGEWQTVTANETAVTLTELIPLKKYEAKVQGNCGGEAGVSEWSDIITFTTDVPCKVPTDLAASNARALTVQLSWKSYSDAWQICLNGDEENLTDVTTDDVTIDNESGTVTYKLTGLTPSTDYTVKVRGNCGSEDGVSEWTEAVSFTTAPPCQVPTNLATADPSWWTVQLSWESDGDAWQICLNGDEENLTDVTTDDVTTDGNRVITYTLSGLAPGTAYSVKVRGNCGSDDGVSEWAEVSFTTLECLVSDDVAVSDIGVNTATVGWTGNSDSYDVKYRTSAVPKLSETFDKSDDLLDGWNQYSIGAVDDVVAGNAALNIGGEGSWTPSANALGAYNMSLNIMGYRETVWLITPEVTPGSADQLDFDLALTSYDSEEPATGTCEDDRFVVLVCVDNKWTILREWNNKNGSAYVYNNISTTGQHVSINLSAYASKTVRIAFYGESMEYGNDDNDLHIDNVVIGLPAGAWQTVSNITETSAQLTGLSSGTKYDVKVVSACGDESEVATFTTLEESADIVFAKEGYATYYNSQRAMTVPDGMKARIVTAKGTTDADGNILLTYETIAGGDSGTDIVPSGTAVLLQVAPADAPQTITVPLAADPSDVTYCMAATPRQRPQATAATCSIN